MVDNEFVSPPSEQRNAVILMHMEDMLLISLGWLIFLQCIAHPVFFWKFESLPVAERVGAKLHLRLKIDSDLHEFGLEQWNHALNNLYWYFCIALIIPILSRISQPNLDSLDASQVFLQFAIPIMVAIPMISTIVVRQNRLPDCWDQVTSENKKKYFSQRLWPLDKNWSSKLGIVLAFVILGLSFGINVASIL